jgi:uncharacterized membrane protein YdjX (TVP38/TMEM64 family)
VNKKKKKEITSILLVVLLASAVSLAMYTVVRLDVYERIIVFISESVSPALFIATMFVLPIFGFSISVFLVLGGVKFGIIHFILLWIMILPLHVLIAYYLARWARRPLKNFLLYKLNYRLPSIPEKHVARFSFLFLAFPGIPYAGKNYILPLAGVPFRYSFIMNTIVQGAIGLPFIILGKSAANVNLTIFNATLAIMVAGYVLRCWLKDRFGD